MALTRDWSEILRVLEATVPQATGGTSYDETLRKTLVVFANQTLQELDEEQRWSLSLNFSAGFPTAGIPNFTTVANQQVYDLSTQFASTTKTWRPEYIKRVYYKDENGKPHIIEQLDKFEAQRVYGDYVAGPPIKNVGAPVWYSMDSAKDIGNLYQFGAMTLYPTPDNAGPDSTNYKIYIEAYTGLPPIVELQGTTTASNTTLTTKTNAVTWLQNVMGVQNGSPITVRAAGYDYGTAVDDHVTQIAGFLTASTLQLTDMAIAAVTLGQVFVNSQNWLISKAPRMLVCGVLKEVACYYGSDAMFQKWYARYQDLLQRLKEYDMDRATQSDAAAIAVLGQRTPALRRLDLIPGFDVRGGDIT